MTFMYLFHPIYYYLIATFENFISAYNLQYFKDM